MPTIDTVVECPLHDSFRVRQIAGMFDLPLSPISRQRFTVELPGLDEPWQIGLIVGPSGSGKTTIARQAFGPQLCGHEPWPDHCAVIDALGNADIHLITQVLTSVGFSSPPAWLKPYAVLSNGEKFRCDLARALLALPIADCRLPIEKATMPNADCQLPIEKATMPSADCQLPIEKATMPNADCQLPNEKSNSTMLNEIPNSAIATMPNAECRMPNKKSNSAMPNEIPNSAFAIGHLALTHSALPDSAFGIGHSPIVIDEFTSVVDRTVAKMACAALAKAIRSGRIARRFVAVSCHYDIAPWLGPDWVLDMADGKLARGRLCRPDIQLRITRASPGIWRIFKHHHYLNASLHPAAQCFVGMIENSPAVFTAVLPFPHATRPGWREHRTVCLPDFQGLGIGNAMSEFVAALYRATGKPYRSVTSHPAMLRYRAASRKWRMTRPPDRCHRHSLAHLADTGSTRRITASFEYVGPARLDEAIKFGLIPSSPLAMYSGRGQAQRG